MNELALQIGNKLAEMKADGVVVADVKDITPLTDSYVVAGATSDRQLNGYAEAVYKILKETNSPLNHVEGRNGSKWIVVDCYDVIVHLFEKGERLRTRFDELIAKCPKVELSEREEVNLAPNSESVYHLDSSYGESDEE